MDRTSIAIQLEGARALLGAGVSAPLFSFRLPLLRQPFQIRVAMKRPTMSAIIQMSSLYLKLGVTYDELLRMDDRKLAVFTKAHGRDLSRIIAYAICHGYMSRHLLIGLTAWAVRNFMGMEYQKGCIEHFVRLTATAPFEPIIRSAEMINIMKPRLSQESKGS